MNPPGAAPSTPLGRVLAVTFLASLGTGVFWHGLAFIAKHGYGFAVADNLRLYVFMGVIYAGSAFTAGRQTRALARVLSPRGVLAVTLALQGGLSLLPVAVDARWALLVTAAAVSWLSALAWPLVESFLTAGRHGPAMRRAISLFNLTWMPAMVVPMVAMAPLLETRAVWAIGGLAITNALALAGVLRFPARPEAHDAAVAAAHVTPRYARLLRSARVLLPLSYLLKAAIAPLLPYRLEAIGVPVEWETTCAATWMAVRVVAVVVMWRLPFWHGRWGTLLLGAASMAGGVAAVILARDLAWMLFGFAALGVGVGVIYYAALYYAMAVGAAEIDAGGTHEGLIGAGYAAGPAAALLGLALGGGPAIVVVVWIALAAGAVPAALPWVAERRRLP